MVCTDADVHMYEIICSNGPSRTLRLLFIKFGPDAANLNPIQASLYNTPCITLPERFYHFPCLHSYIIS